MLGLVSSFLQYTIIGICFLSLSVFFFSLAASLRLLPAALSALRWLLRGVLILSYRLHHLLLSHTTPLAELHLGISLLSGLPRLVACMLVSVTLALSIVLLVGWPRPAWVVGLSLLHGLLVGLAWEELERPEGLHLGVRIE